VVRVDANEGVLHTMADLSLREPMPTPAQAVSHGRGYFKVWRNTVTSAEEGASNLFTE
jgi:phosphogluconate dehydratase